MRVATAQALEQAYRVKVRALLDVMASRLEREYGRRVSLEDLDRTFALFVKEAVAIVAAAQAAGVSLALAYLRASLAQRAGRPVEPAPLPFSPVGINEQRKPLAQGLAAIPAMMKREIGRGRPLSAVRDLGRSLVVRFGDAETSRAMDVAITTAASRTPQVVGWEGFIEDTACPGCQTNEGRHLLTQTMYRHPGCNCVRQWIVDSEAGEMVLAESAA